MKRLKQAGRPTKKIKRVFDPARIGTELMIDRLRQVFVEYGAPALWVSEAAFIFDVMLFPRIISAAVPTRFTFSEEEKKIQTERSAVNAAKFGHIFAQSPDLFCKCLVEFNRRGELLEKNQRFQTALILAGDEVLAGKKAQEIAALLEAQGINGVTARTVEHARADLRRMK